MSRPALERARQAYAAEIRRLADLRTGGLARGLATVRREDFIGPGPWKLLDPEDFAAGYKLTADDDPVHLQARVLVALDAERSLNNGDPVSLVGWLDALALQEGDRFLHVGCGVGYYTAVAACALGRSGEAVGIEIDPDLAARARANLAAMTNASAEVGDGGTLARGEFDAILVNAGATRVAEAWLTALREGGRLLVPLTVEASPRIGFGGMLLVTRANGDWPARFVSPVIIYHCAGARDLEEERDLRESLERGDSQGVRALRFDAHRRDDACWLHGSRYCLTRRPPAAVVASPSPGKS